MEAVSKVHSEKIICYLDMYLLDYVIEVSLNAFKFKLITRVFAVINRQTPFVKLRQAG